MPAKKKHEITHPPTSPTLTPSPTSDTFEASTCSELCTRHKHPPGGLLQATSCKASTLNPLATSCSKSSAQVSSLSSTTFQAPATSQDPQTLVLKTAETTKLVHPFRNTVEVITPLSSSNLVTSSTSSLNKTAQATKLLKCSLDGPAQEFGNQSHTPAEEFAKSTELLKTTKDLPTSRKVSFSSRPAPSATIEPHSENQSPRVSDRIAPLKSSKTRSKDSPAPETRSSSFTKSLSPSINSYATAKDSPLYVSGFLGRHHSQDRAPSIPRSVSFGTARELRSTALASFKDRSYTISGSNVPPRSVSLGNIQEIDLLRSVRSQSVSISSTEELHDLLSLNTEPLFIDIEKRRNHDFVFPASTLVANHPITTPRRRSSAKSRSFSIPRRTSPSPSLAVPLVYRSASAATLHDHHRRKEPVFVPTRIDRQQRSTEDTMATQGSANPFDDFPASWQGDCPVRAASAMTQPLQVPANQQGAVALFAAAETAAAATAATAAVPAAPARPAPVAPAPAAPAHAAPARRRRDFFRRLGDRLRRLVGRK